MILQNVNTNNKHRHKNLQMKVKLLKTVRKIPSVLKYIRGSSYQWLHVLFSKKWLGIFLFPSTWHVILREGYGLAVIVYKSF